jgi:glycerol-3-phosphate dehydrogenase subunit C
MSHLPRNPSVPPATSPNDPRYYDERDLEFELRRTFQVCHECRMCVNYCGSFPVMFQRIDRDIESGKSEGAEHIDYDDIKAVADECWQCKLCYIKCPYTADEGAKELLDVPRLFGRERAVRAKREGIPLVDTILGEPHVVGALGSGAFAPMANLIQASRLLRKVQEKVTGISAEFPLPPMARQPFADWHSRHAPGAAAGENGEVVLYATCYGEYNLPGVPRAATLVLEHNGVRVHRAGDPADPEFGEAPVALCCGMPNLDGGDVEGFVRKVKRNVDVLLPHVRKGRKVVVVGPTCGYTAKKEWAEYAPTPEAKEVAAATVDLMEYLVQLGREKKLKREFKKGLGAVAYQAACHLRAQKIGFPGARVLGIVPDTDVRVIEECSAVDGTWGMKADHYEMGRKYAARLVREVRGMEPDVVVSDCSLAGLRVEKENGVRVVHPVEALAEAYGLIESAAGGV